MLNVTVTRRFTRPADDLWKLVGDFYEGSLWLPHGATVQTLRDEGVRDVTIAPDAPHMREHVLDVHPRGYRYEILSGPVPIKNYTAEFRIEPAGEAHSLITWSADFDADGASDQAAVDAIEAIFSGGLSRIDAALGGSAS